MRNDQWCGVLCDKSIDQLICHSNIWKRIDKRPGAWNFGYTALFLACFMFFGSLNSNPKFPTAYLVSIFRHIERIAYMGPRCVLNNFNAVNIPPAIFLRKCQLEGLLIEEQQTAKSVMGPFLRKCDFSLFWREFRVKALKKSS